MTQNTHEAEEGSQGIRVFCDSLANIASTNEHFVMAYDLGFGSRSEWDSASESEKMDAVIEYWHSQGCPEIYWED